MAENKLAQKLIHSMLPKLRIGEYHMSIPYRYKKKLITIDKYSANDGIDSFNHKQKIYFASSFKNNFEKCFKYGGYRKMGSKYYWSHRKLKYFDFKKNVYGGLPQFVLGANLVKFESVQYTPHRWKPNTSNKYTFSAKSIQSNTYDIDKAFALNIGMIESFGHFVQDCIPILAHSRYYLNENPDIKIILPNALSNAVDINYYLKELGIINKIIKTKLQDTLNIKELIFWNFIPYNAKFIIPKNWYKEISGVFNKLELDTKNRTFILLTRQESSRNIMNMNELSQNLKDIAKESELIFKIVNTSVLRLEDYEEDIKKSKIIVGVHGGASFNIIFAPTDCHFFEIIPTIGTDSVIHFATGLGINYHPIPLEFEKSDYTFLIGKNDLSNLNEEIRSII